MPSLLNPYIHFESNAAEAMEFYRSVFGGDLTTSTFAEGGMPHDPADANKLMHAQLDTPNGFVLMAADTPPGMPSGAISGITISLSGHDDAELTGYWEKLSDGATISAPLEAAPWGDKFGMLTDRFGVPWFVNVTGAGSHEAT